MMWRLSGVFPAISLLATMVAMSGLSACSGTAGTGEQTGRDGSNCVTVTRLRSTEIIDNRTILFHMTGGRSYRNTLPSACAGLSQHDAFEYQVPTTQLCRGDIITVLNRIGPGAGTGFVPIGSCALGDFEAISREEVQILRGREPAEEGEGAAEGAGA